MKGKEIRSFRQLARAVGDSVTKIFYTFENYGEIREGKCILAENGSNKTLHIFNNSFGEKTSRTRLSSLSEDKSYLLNNYAYVLTINLSKESEYKGLLKSIIMLPQDFENEYSKFCEANKKYFQKFSNSIQNDEICKYIYCITNGSKNFFNWAVDLFFLDATPHSLIRLIMCWNERYSQLSKDLAKGTITAYTSRASAYSSYKEMSNLRDKKRANDAINFFNTSQKKLLKGSELSKNDIKILSQFERLSAVKKKNFVRKMSTIENVNEILYNISLLVATKFQWNKTYVIEFIKNSELMDCEIVIDKENMLLIKAKNYEAIKQLGRFTSWCISKNKHYWDEYVGTKNDAAVQYVLFDFSKKEDDKLSVVGFTSIINRGITNAHNLNNDNLMGPRVGSVRFEKFIQKRMRNNIYDILEHHRINIDDVTEYEPLPFEWSKKGFMDYFQRFISNYSILAETETRMVIDVNDEGIADFFGEKYKSYFESATKYEEHIIFVDFSLPQRKFDKIFFFIVYHNSETAEDTTSQMFDFTLQSHDYSFDSQITKYGIPYDIISRSDNIGLRLRNAINSYDIITLNGILSNEQVRNDIKCRKIKISDALKRMIESSLYGEYTFDLVDTFYNNNISLVDLIGVSNTESIVYGAFNNVFSGTRGTMTLSEEILQRIEIGNYSGSQLNLFVNFEVLNHLIERERCLPLFFNINHSLMSCPANKLFDKIVKIEVDIMKNMKVNINRLSNVLSVFSYGLKNNISEVINFISENGSLQAELIKKGVAVPSVTKS